MNFKKFDAKIRLAPNYNLYQENTVISNRDKHLSI